MKTDQAYIKKTLKKLVQINSVNPSLSPGAPGEKEIAMFLAEKLEKLGIDSKVDSFAPDRANVIAKIPGKGRGHSLMINAHMDTVGVENMEDPFSGIIKGNKLYGRGSQDMKGSIAAILSMLKSIKEREIRLNGDLVIAFVADEEFESTGTIRLLEEYQTDGAIITEPTDLDLCVAHKGFGLFQFRTQGRAAHGGSPSEGIDAIMHMGRIMAELDKLTQKYHHQSPHPLLGTPSLHIPTIKGGSEPFTYADSCVMQVEKRTLPGDSLDKVMAEFQSVLDDLSKKDGTFDPAITPLIWRAPFEAARNSRIADTVFDSVEEAMGKAPSRIGHTWWEDSGLTGEKGIDTVVIGPAGGGLHTSEEWVDLRSVQKLSEILYQSVQIYCNSEK